MWTDSLVLKMVRSDGSVVGDSLICCAQNKPPAVIGDVNADGTITVSDIVYLINYLFKLGPAPIPIHGVGDANCDGKVSVLDVVYLINYLFKGGPAPC